MPPIEEKVIDGILCWRHYSPDNTYRPWNQYSAEQLTDMLVKWQEAALEVQKIVDRDIERLEKLVTK